MVCGIQQALAPILGTIALVVVLLFLGAFGGKVGKIIALVGIVVVYLWWFGLSEVGLQPIRRYAGQAIAAALVAVPDPTEWRRWRDARTWGRS